MPFPVGAGPERPPRQERDDFDQAAILFAPVAPCLQQDGKELASEVVPEIRQRAVHADLIPTDRKRSNKTPAFASFAIASGGCLLRWPTNASAYRLECATAVDGSAAWLSVFDPPVTEGDAFTVFLFLTDERKYFRLVQP